MAALYINVNWLAVIAGTVGAFALGGIWYSSKLFGTKWAEGSHIQAIEGHPIPALIVQALGTFFMAWVIGIAVGAEAWVVAYLIILSVATTLAGSCLFSQKSSYAILTETAFVIVGGVIMLVCQAVI